MTSKSPFIAAVLVSIAASGCSSSNEQPGNTAAGTTAAGTTAAGTTAAAAPAAPQIVPPPAVAPGPTQTGPIQTVAPAQQAAAPATTAAPATSLAGTVSSPASTSPAASLPGKLTWFDSEHGMKYEGDVMITNDKIELKEKLKRVPGYVSRDGSPVGVVEWVDPATGDTWRRRAVVGFPHTAHWTTYQGAPWRVRDIQLPSDILPERPAEHPDTVIPLPGPVNDVVAGAGGRYLVIAMTHDRQVAVVDIREAAIKKLIPMATDNFIVAAGATRFVVIDREHKTLTRYGFATLSEEQQAAVELELDGASLAAMGCSSEGPLWLVQRIDQEPRDVVHLFDLNSLAPVAVTRDWSSKVRNQQTWWELSTNSAGDVLCMGVSGQFSKVVRKTGGTLVAYTDGDVRRQPLAVLDDGLHVTSNEYVEAAQEGGRAFRSLEKPNLSRAFTASPGWLTARFPKLTWHESMPVSRDLEIGFHRRLDPHPDAILRLAGLGVEAEFDLAAQGRKDFRTPSLARRMQYVPGEKTFVYVTRHPERVLLKRFDIEPAAARRVAELAIESTPVTSYRPEQPWQYQVAIRSTRGEPRYSLEFRPPKMTVSPTGLIEWIGEKSYLPPRVVVRVTDAAGQSAFQEFILIDADKSRPAGKQPGATAAPAVAKSSSPSATATPTAAAAPAGTGTPSGTAGGQPVAAALAAEMRTWSSVDGMFKVEAQMTGVLNGKVVLKTVDGKRIEVALDQLSPADKEVVKKRYPQLK